MKAAWISFLVFGAAVFPSAVGAQNVPRATLVDDEVVPKAIPVGPDGQPLRAAVVKDPVVQPTGPDEDLFSYANMLYERGEYKLALQSLSQYLQEYPAGRHIGGALFRIGECYVKSGMEANAVRFYEDVVNRYPSSEGAPSAAYRLGAIAFNARQFRDSVRYFRFCEQATKVPQVRLAAIYNRSRAHQLQGEEAAHLEALRSVIAVTADNPYRDAALLVLAKEALADDDLDRALELFGELRTGAGTSEIRSEATINEAVVRAERGEQEEAVALFEEALKMAGTTPANRGIALVGVLQALYDKGDFDGVIANYTRNASLLPDTATRGKMLLLVGNAYRMKKVYSRAVELYLMVEQDHPEQDAAFEAGYWKLYCFYLLDDPDLADFANGFLKRWAGKKEDNPLLAKAALIRADHYFNRSEYTEAAEAFLDVPMEDLSDQLRPNALFNQGFSLVEAERYQDAIGTLTRFLNENETHELRANALAQRGLAHREVRDLGNAKADFNAVITDYRKSPAAEMAWYQLGMIASDERDPKAKIEAFEALVEAFPQSQAVPQAWFGIGSAAYELEDWNRAQEALRKAIRLAPEEYLVEGYQLLLLSHYAEEDAVGLAETIDAYVERNPNAAIAPNILGWLGLTLFSKDDFPGCAKYLKLAVNLETPENTQAVIWNYFGMAQVEVGAFQPALMALNHFLDGTPEPGPERGKALLYKARAYLGMGEHDRAIKAADEALKFIKTGRLQAQLLILQGDTWMDLGNKQTAARKAAEAEESYRKAAAKYIIPSQFFVDPEITPVAVWKTIQALEKIGEDERAGQLRQELSKKYPDFKIPS